MKDLILKETVPELAKVAVKTAAEVFSKHPVETTLTVVGFTGGFLLGYQKGRADTLEEIINAARNAQQFH